MIHSTPRKRESEKKKKKKEKKNNKRMYIENVLIRSQTHLTQRERKRKEK